MLTPFVATALRLAQHAHNLGFGEAALLHRKLLAHLAKNILLPHPANHGEDYQNPRRSIVTLLQRPLFSEENPLDIVQKPGQTCR